MSPPFLDIDLSTFRLEFQTPSATGWESSLPLSSPVIRSSFVWTRDIPTWMGYIYSSNNTPFSFRLDFFFFWGGFLFFSSFICLFVEIGFLYFAIFARETRSSKRVRKWSKFDKVSPARTTRFYPPLGKFEFPAMNLIIEFGQISQKNIFTKISRGMKMVSKLVDQGSPFQPFPESESLFSSQKFLFPASWRSKRVLELPFPPFNRERTKFPFLTNTSLR